jgi:hypothetical protein
MYSYQNYKTVPLIFVNWFNFFDNNRDKHEKKQEMDQEQ